ncbi:MAG TPA: alpha/beta hydrolase, partial [Anaerolineaceae bacterium]|nr:alpha/beta hydrolase [Anaerolineaceae bacterium]
MKSPLNLSDIQIRDIFIDGQDGAQIRLRVYQPGTPPVKAPALLWMHGGGYVMGMPEQDDIYVLPFVREVGLVVVSVDYRLAPDNPFPVPLEDCYAALQWMTAQAEISSIDPNRIAIGGSSAGAGLAAALAQVAHDRGEINPVLQLLVYPMLDDRTGPRKDIEPKAHVVWNNTSNQFGWESYLGQSCGAETAPAGSVPARRDNLAGLPPAWIGVGTNDLFYDEAAAYAQRLSEAGVPCELVPVPGAFHAFDLFAPKMQAVRDFRQAQVVALKKALYRE